MRYVIIAVLVYLGFLLLRVLLRNFLGNKVTTSDRDTGKTKRTYDLDKVQDAEYTEVKKDNSKK